MAALVHIVYLGNFRRLGSSSRRSAVALLIGLWLTKRLVSSWRERRRIKGIQLKQRARQKEAESKKKEVRQQCSGVTDSRAIMDKPVQVLIQEMRSGKLSVVQVLHAFQKEALDLTDQINCVTEPVVEAEAQANQMEEERSNPNGLLYGLPVSIKESVSLAGYDVTLGIAKYAGHLMSEDAVIVKVLKYHGAIPYVRTNIPQSQYSFSCKNPIFGLTRNPHNHRLTPGGSSGGEGAIIGGGASIIGLGTDVGGSLRIPAHFCGCFALKPTLGRVSRKGLKSFSNGNIAIQGVPGPMARDFDSLLLASKALFSDKMYELDPVLPVLPFDETVLNSHKPLRIGYYTYDGHAHCFPSSVRAVLEAKSALERRGHELVEFDFPKIMGEGFDVVNKYARIMTADRGKKLQQAILHETMEPGLKRLTRGSHLPVWFCKLVSWMLAPVDPIMSKMSMAAIGYDSVFDYQEGLSELVHWKEAFVQAWQDECLDAVLAPVFVSSAPTVEDVEYVTMLGSYTMLYNSANLPVGVMPVTKVSRADIEAARDPAKFKVESRVVRKVLKSVAATEGLSVGVQCAALPFREEVCLRVMQDLDQALGNQTDEAKN